MTWQRGQSGNPGGRPKTKPWTAALQLIADEPDPTDKTRTRLQRLARQTWDAALEGDWRAREEIGNRLEGRPVQQAVLSGDDDAPMQTKVTVEFVEPRSDNDGS